MIKLYYPHTNKIKDVINNPKNIINELYFNLASIDKSNDNLEIIKTNISEYKKVIPMYDAVSKNIFLIKYNNVYDRLVNYNYRLISKKILNKLHYLLKTTKDINDEYYDLLKKNINFIENYDLNVLKKNFTNIIYKTNPITNDITQCEKKSFLFYQHDKNNKIINPYYTKNELISLKKIYNIKETLEEKPKYFSQDHMGARLTSSSPRKTINNKLCKSINNFDIDSNILLQHQIYLNYNVAKSYVQYYSLLGSFLFNSYLRNDKSVKDTTLEKYIYNFHKIINKSPSFDKNYTLFRFIDNDNYLKNININDIFYEVSFISTTRDPLFNFNTNNDMYYLIKIFIPSKIEGVGLSIESYSLFSYEKEIVLCPSKLKLINIIHNVDKPNKIYEFEFIETINIDKILNEHDGDLIKISEMTIPFIDFYNIETNIFNSTETDEIIMEFINLIPNINNRKIFKTKINNDIYDFDLNIVISNKIYHKFYFLQNNNVNKNVIYLTLLAKETCNIDLLIEISDIISVNYIHRYCGTPISKINDDDMIKFLGHLSYHLKIENVLIHSKYSSYLELYDSLSININDKFISLNKYSDMYIADTTYFSIDFINYIENNIKRFDALYIKNIVKYFHIDEIMMTDSLKIIIINETDPIYKLYRKYNLDKIKNLYIFIHHNAPKYLTDLHILINKYIINKQIKFDYPITKPMYQFKPYEYLLHKNIIKYIPIFNTKINNDLLKYKNANDIFYSNIYRS